MAIFAKLYKPRLGVDSQILVKLDKTWFGPEVRIYHQPKDKGVCSVAFEWDDTDDGWDKAEKYFNSVDRDKSIELATKYLEFEDGGS